jgi:hypothetical protein
MRERAVRLAREPIAESGEHLGRCGERTRTAATPTPGHAGGDSRASSMSRSGACIAAKWPPRSNADQRTIMWSRSAKRWIVEPGHELDGALYRAVEHESAIVRPCQGGTAEAAAVVG